jgi:peptidase E
VKRLLLASSGIGALPKLVDGGRTDGLRFVFVPTAAWADAEEEWWVRADRRQLEALGCELTTLDLATAVPGEVRAALSPADGVFVTGGESELLTRAAGSSGFAELVVPLVGSGELLYAGTSAGAILAGPCEGGLGLVDFTVLPHDQEPEAAAHHDELVAADPGSAYIRLSDDRAVVVRGQTVTVVDSPHLGDTP